MRYFTIALIILVSAFCNSYATTPTMIHWPVGSTVEMMNMTKPLMSSYGDRANGWTSFHAGIDIDPNSEAANGDYIRCVADGYISYANANATGNGYDIVITTEIDGSTGWTYAHISNPTIANPDGHIWQLHERVFAGTLIQTMNSQTSSEDHLHFSYENFVSDALGTGLLSPLDYLIPNPEGSDYWHFNPGGLESKHMFLPEELCTDWNYGSHAEVVSAIIPDDNLQENVDFFFGVTLLGESQESGGLDVGYRMDDSTPEKVYWKLNREKVSESETLSENFLVNFDCSFYNGDERSKMFTFNWLMHNHFLGNYAGFMCLTNC